MKKALLLTYYWPPGSGPGVQRWLKFCKFLPEFEWQVEVITVAEGSYPSFDETLLKDIPKDLQVFHTKTLEPFAFYNALRGKKGKQVEVGMSNLKGEQSLFKRFSNYVRANYFVPDARVGWNTYAFPMAMKRIKAFQPDVIITTGPPHSTHLIGERLQKMYKLPWVVDMRDPWTNIYYNRFLNRTAATIRKDQKLEDRVIGKADLIVAASPGLEDEFRERAKKIVFIPNGFDEEDFEDLKATDRKELTLAYVGNLKSNQNINALWRALNEVNTAHPDRSIKLEITGNVAEDVVESIAQHGITNDVSILPFVPHREAVQRMINAHVLLLPIPQSEHNKSILTGKLFEYLATQRPILAIGPIDGNASKILLECGHAPMLAYEDQGGITDRLKADQKRLAEEGRQWVIGNERYSSFSRRRTTEQLAKAINPLIS